MGCVLPAVLAAQAEMRRGSTTSQALVKRFLARIKKLDQAYYSGLRAIIVLNPHALTDARKFDAERGAGHVRGPLHGVPVLLKDNIESDDDTATTAGSLALKDNVSHRDAPLVKRLKDARAVILGKTNLSDWANSRSTQSDPARRLRRAWRRRRWAPRPTARSPALRPCRAWSG
jgi:amidase